MFRKGDLVVYPAHGIGRIDDVQVELVGGKEKRFLVVRIIENDMKIMLPLGNTSNIGIRPLINKEEIHQVFDVLKKREISVVASTWNRRYKEYMDKIRSGSIYDLAEVFRNLYLIQLEKNLSFGEKKMFDMAKSLMVKEIALVAGISESEVEEMVYRLMVEGSAE
ncbi:MAG: CarD family transcriptional regulator [Syntrophobacterales bacterium]|nr:CarD family transcriptional regulator [Syntrophobacterales bacterium]